MNAKCGAMRAIVAEINKLEPAIAALMTSSSRAKTDEFRERLAKGETLDDLLPEAFAVVREASKRTIGQRHYDVQLIGGIVLHQGRIAEMATGEGKTLVATLPLYLNALDGKGAHLVTVNDYLAKRDAVWKGPIYHLLGLTVASSQSQHERGSTVYDRTSCGRPALQRPASRSRAASLRCDITYGTNNEFGFDYLRDNMVMSARATWCSGS